jgi:hypothetical protein
MCCLLTKVNFIHIVKTPVLHVHQTTELSKNKDLGSSLVIACGRNICQSKLAECPSTPIGLEGGLGSSALKLISTKDRTLGGGKNILCLIARCFSKNQELETFVGFLGFLGKLMGLIKTIQKHNKRVFKV